MRLENGPDFSSNEPSQDCTRYMQQRPARGMVPEMGVGAWVLTLFLTSIPFVNLIAIIIWAAGGCGYGKEARVNFARAHLVWAGISIVIFIALFLLLCLGAVTISLG